MEPKTVTFSDYISLTPLIIMGCKKKWGDSRAKDMTYRVLQFIGNLGLQMQYSVIDI